MKKAVVFCLGALFPVQAAAITQIVDAGDVLTGGSVNSIVTQEVYGTTKNFSVYGNQTLMNGGKSYDSNIFSYAQQNVQKGGVSYNTNVQYQAIQNVDGEAYSSTVATQGTIDVNNGGYAQNTTVNGGIFIVSSGAVVTRTTLNGGRENISGTDESSLVKAGLQEVLNNGISKQANIVGGMQQVDAGGISIGATVSGNGRQKVWGTTEQTVVQKGGIIDIIDSGSAKETTIDGGEMNVDFNAVSSQTTINSGEQTIYGIDNDSQINGGTQKIESGGKAVNALVRSGGVQSVFSGGEAENTTLEKGGWLFLFSGGQLSGKTQITEGVATVIGDNSIPDLELKNAAVTIPYNHEFSTLQFDKLNGSGLFSINSSLSEGVSDKILVHSGDGNFGLIIHDYSPSGNTPSQYKIINEGSGAADNFYLVGDAVDVGAFRYQLAQDGDDWILVRTQDVNDSAIIAKNTYASLSSLFYTHLTPVYNHIRSRRNPSGHDDGLWMKALGQKLDFKYKDGTSSRTHIYGSEIGYDKEIWRHSGHYLSLGAYGGYTSSRQKFDRSSHGNADTRSVGLYSLFNTNDNWFIDLVGTYFWHDQKIKSFTPSGSDVRGKYKTNSWQVSTSLGKRFNFDGQWFLEPSVGLNYMHIDGISYRTNFNTLVETSGADYFSSRADLVGGKTFLRDGDGFIDAYGRLALIHDIDSKSEVRIADYTFTEDMSSLRYEVGAGISASWSQDGTAYFEASTQLGDRIEIPWEINLGIQYRF